MHSGLVQVEGITAVATDPNAVAGSINGLIAPGTGITTTGAGTAVSPYTINSVWTQSGNNIFNNNTGNVGIGTTTPGALLTIAGANTFLNISQSSSTAMDIGSGTNLYLRAGSGAGILFQPNLSSPAIATNIQMRLWPSGGLSLGNAYYLNDPGASGSMIVAGNVGIGTASPDKALTIFASDAVGNLRLRNSAATRYRSDYFINSTGYTTINSYDENTATYIPLYIDGSKIILNGSNGGNVGIGTGAPTAPLHIVGGASGGAVQALVQHSTGTAGQAQLSLQSTGTGGRAWDIISADSGYTNGAGLNFLSNGVFFAKFDLNGRLGLGTNAPSADLHIKAGTAAAGSAPVKLTSGVNLTTPEDGAIEYNGTHFYATVGTTRYQLDQQLASSVSLLATVTGINASTIANTALFTVPAGKTAIVTAAVVRVTAATSITAGPTAGIGNVAGTNNIAASAALTNLQTTANTFTYTISGASLGTAAAGVIYFNLGLAATGTSETLAVDLIGYLI